MTNAIDPGQAAMDAGAASVTPLTCQLSSRVIRADAGGVQRTVCAAVPA